MNSVGKILVLGYFGFNTNQLDGQTVKTRDVYRLACDTYESVDNYDTEDFKYSKLSILKMFWKVITCDTLMYLPAHNNLKYIFPIIYFLSVVFRFKIHYFVVGGWLKEYLEGLPMHRQMLKRISGIHVETKLLKNQLEESYNYVNVDVFPNFRFYDFIPSHTNHTKLRLVFMARINKLKGLDWIFSLANYIATQNLTDKFDLTFYGPIFKDDQEYFESELQKYPFAKYAGALQPNEIYSALNNYDVLLLPTHYYTEGLPGSIVDAYISGIPVIVTEWKHSHEFVDNGYSGYIIPFENGIEELIHNVMYLEENRDVLNQLQQNVLNKRIEFQPPSLKDFIE